MYQIKAMKEKMKKLTQKYNTIFLILIISCAVPLKQTQLLKPGLNKTEVKQILKEPYITSYKNGYFIWDYHLQYVLNSGYPFRLVFDREEKLVWWGFNDDESKRILKAIEDLKGTEVLPNTIIIKD